MNAPPDPLPTAQLSAHAASLHALAQRLVRDAGQADDLVQQTWLRAVERPPRDRSRIGRWLRTVLRNEARQLHRGDAARRRREERSARPETAASEDVVERTEQIERLLATVRRLPEPYRTAMLLRWVDGLSPSTIAEHLGEPAGTVRSRLSRGMELLKTRLDQSHGTRRGWALALVPAAAHAIPGALAMKGTIKLAIAAVALIAMGTGGWFAANAIWSDTHTGTSEHLEVSSAGDGLTAGGALEGRAPPEAAIALTPPDPDAGTWLVKGRVLGASRAAIEGAHVTVDARWPGRTVRIGEAQTNAAGAYRIPLSALESEGVLRRGTAKLTVRADKAGMTSEPAGQRELTIPEDPRGLPLTADLRLLPGAMVRGRVFDPDGEPVAGGNVKFVWPSGAKTSDEVDAEGRYAMRVSGSHKIRVEYMRANLGSGRSEFFHVREGVDTTAPDLQLHGGGQIEGVAQFPDGSPAGHVAVLATRIEEPGETLETLRGLRASNTRTDVQGRFTLSALAPGRYRVFHQRNPKPRLTPAIELGARGVQVPVHGQRILLRVRDAEGRPLPGAGYLLRFNLEQDYPDVSSGRLEAEDGTLSLWAGRGALYEVAANVKGSSYATRRVVVPATGNEEVVDLVLRERGGEVGSLRYRVQDDTGQLVPTSDVRLVTRLAESLVVKGTAAPAKGWQRLPHVPPGEYTLRIVPGAPEPGPPLTMWFATETPATVRPGETSEVTLAARQGGRLRLTATGSADAYTPSLWRIRMELRREGAEIARRLRSFVLVRKDGSWRHGSYQLGKAMTAFEVLEPGAYTFTATYEDRILAEESVVIVAGRTTDLVIALPDGDK